MATETRVDDRYYQAAPPRSIAARLMIAARNRMYRDFARLMAPKPHERILDVGVSDVIEEGTNMLERLYPYPEEITACGIGECRQFQATFPMVSFVQIKAGERLPFPDNHFQIATANAVLEHVGSPEAQEAFVRELARVAPRVFISVPNRFFPFEHHTLIPIAHYNDATWRLACRVLGRDEWAQQENLILMSRRKLARLASGLTGDSESGVTGLQAGPFSSNLYLAVTR